MKHGHNNYILYDLYIIYIICACMHACKTPLYIIYTVMHVIVIDNYACMVAMFVYTCMSGSLNNLELRILILIDIYNIAENRKLSRENM